MTNLLHLLYHVIVHYTILYYIMTSAVIAYGVKLYYVIAKQHRLRVQGHDRVRAAQLVEDEALGLALQDLWYTADWYSISYWSMLLTTILTYTMVYYTTLHSTPLHSTLLYYTLLYSTVLYCTILYYTITYYSVLQYPILSYPILYHIILYCDHLSYYVRPRISESKFRNHCAKKLDGALRKPTSFV